MERDAGSGTFLYIDGQPRESIAVSYTQLKKGSVLIENSREQDSPANAFIPGGIIHDWTGLIFIPNVSLRQTLDMLQDYDHDDRYYSPEVVKSKLLARSGDEFHVSLQLR